MKRIKLLAILLLILIVSIVVTQIIGLLSNSKPLMVNGKSTNVNVLPASSVWTRVYGGQEDDRAFDAVLAGTGYLIVGSTKSIVPNTLAGWAIRLASNGNAMWNKTFLDGTGTELRFAVNLTDGILLVGNEYPFSGGIDGYVAKIDNQGNVIWNTTIGYDKTSEFYSAFQTPDGFVLLGLTSPNGGADSNGWLVKIAPDGTVSWNKSYNFALDTVFKAGVLTPKLNYAIAGYTNIRGANNYDFLLINIDPAGNLIWNQTYGGLGTNEAHAMATAPDGFVIVGDTQSEGSNIHALVAKVDWNGTLLWSKIVGGENADSPSCIAPDQDTGYLVGGFTFSWGAGNRDFWLFKISDSGQVLWSCTFGDVGYQEAYIVMPASKNKIFMAGWTDPPGAPALIGKAKYDFYAVEISVPQNSNLAKVLEFIEYTLLGVCIALAILIVIVKFGKLPKTRNQQQDGPPCQTIKQNSSVFSGCPANQFLLVNKLKLQISLQKVKNFESGKKMKRC